MHIQPFIWNMTKLKNRLANLINDLQYDGLDGDAEDDDMNVTSNDSSYHAAFLETSFMSKLKAGGMKGRRNTDVLVIGQRRNVWMSSLISIMLLTRQDMELKQYINLCWGFYGRSGGTSISAFPQDPAGSW